MDLSLRLAKGLRGNSLGRRLGVEGDRKGVSMSLITEDHHFLKKSYDHYTPQ